MASYSLAQEIFLRQLAGEFVRGAERAGARITKATQESLRRRGLVKYGRFDGSATMGWHLTDEGRSEAAHLVSEAEARRASLT